MRLLPVRVGGSHHRLSVLLIGGMLVVLLAGGGFAALESDTVSGFWEGVWWALSLMTTIGFVGETPETTGGRILSAVLMVAGFAVLALTTAAIASLFVREEEEPAEQVERSFEHEALGRLEQLSARLERIERRLEPSAAPDPGGPREREPD